MPQLIATILMNTPSRVLHFMTAEAAERSSHSLPESLSLSSLIPGKGGSLSLSSMKQKMAHT